MYILRIRNQRFANFKRNIEIYDMCQTNQVRSCHVSPGLNMIWWPPKNANCVLERK
jgi:hypothetical protein